MNRERIERVKGEQQGIGLSPGLLPVPCLEVPLCSEMRIAVCTWASPWGAWGSGRAWAESSPPCSPPSPLHATAEIYLAVRQDRQCKSNPLPINYLFHSAFSSFSPSSHLPPCSPPFFACYPHISSRSSYPCLTPLNMQLPHCNLNLPVRGAVAMWQTCHRNGQFDKCRRVAVHCLQSLPPHTASVHCGAESRWCDAWRGKGMEEREKRRWGTISRGWRGAEIERVTFRGIMSLWTMAEMLPSTCPSAAG